MSYISSIAFCAGSGFQIKDQGSRRCDFGAMQKTGLPEKTFGDLSERRGTSFNSSKHRRSLRDNSELSNLYASYRQQCSAAALRHTMALTVLKIPCLMPIARKCATRSRGRLAVFLGAGVHSKFLSLRIARLHCTASTIRPTERELCACKGICRHGPCKPFCLLVSCLHSQSRLLLACLDCSLSDCAGQDLLQLAKPNDT
jgi:hypothetical protein